MNQTQTENFPRIQLDFKSSGFDEFFLEAIDQTFSMLGTNAKQALFSFLENKYNLNREDIPSRLGDFVDGLEKIFGTGASVLELEVMKTLRHRVPSFVYVVESSDLSFESYLLSLRCHVENL
jgi:hypothetical protein